MRQIRRHHRFRLKEKRKSNWNVYNEEAVVRRINTPKPCSCWMCRNERKLYGLTFQELRFCEYADYKDE